MRRFLAPLIWPAICGVLLALLLVDHVPQLIGSRDRAIPQVPATLQAPAAPNGPAGYADAVARAAPAVVTVSSMKQLSGEETPLMNDPFYRQFRRPPTNATEQPINLGSGVIVSAEGYILTNNHVIRSADEIEVTLADGRTTTASVVGTDPDTDLAVLKISLDNLPAIALADSTHIRTGDIALAIGNPFNVGQTVTSGIISAVGRARLGLSAYENFIQTDASINPGNSGGALVNAEGALIGINTAIFSRSGGSQGIGFAIPTNVARSVLEDIVTQGQVVRGWLGIEAQQEMPLARSLNFNTPGSVVVTSVVPNGPAASAGVRVGDRILEIDGAPLLDPNAAINEIADAHPGTIIALILDRGGRRLEARITVGVRPPNLPTIFNPLQSNDSGEQNAPPAHP